MWIFISVVILLILLFFGAAYYGYRLTFGRVDSPSAASITAAYEKQYEPLYPTMKALLAHAAEIPYEEVCISSFDGLTLVGRYYESSKTAPVQIMFHGYRSHSVRDFSGGLQFYLDLGFNVLLVDQRAHGSSEGRSIAFGALERRDCLSWARYVVERCGPDVPIILTGISMGAATVLMAADLPLPGNVKGIVADSGYSSPKAIIRKVIKDMGYPLGLAYFFVRLGGMLYGGFDIEKSSAQRSIANTNVPILFVHGEDDRFVPVEMSRENHRVCRSKSRLLTIPGAAHGVGFLVDEAAYIAAVKEFYEEIGLTF